MNILFVCTGNTCRSPLAEVLAKQKYPDWEIQSRGIAVFSALPASKYSSRIASEMGLNLEEHTSKEISEDDMIWADIVFGITQRHVDFLFGKFKAYSDKIKPFPGGDVSDPFGGTEEIYLECAKEIIRGIENLCKAC